MIKERIRLWYKQGGWKMPIDLDITYTDEGMMEFRFDWDDWLLTEIKNFEKRKFNFDEKYWYAPLTHRNIWLLAYLKRSDALGPYARYEVAPLDIEPQRVVYSHQKEMFRFFSTYRQCIAAGEPGVGKTLAMFEAAEYRQHQYQPFDAEEVWYVGPKSAVKSVEREYRKWKCLVPMQFMTIDKMVKDVKNWPGGHAPRILMLDEAHKYKTPTSQRSQQAKWLADAMRDEYGQDCDIWLATGTPAPKSPKDWWWLCEIACPGFLRESNEYTFTNRVGVVQEKDNSVTGGVYNQLVTWRDSEDKCKVCGKLADQPPHTNEFDIGYHPWEKGINEVAKLNKRMKGLVGVWLKKDCLDLPDKVYQIIHCKPSQQILQLANTIKNTAPNTITGITRLRELSDGFQYFEKQDGTKPCEVCHGTAKYKTFFDPENPDEAISDEALESGRVIEKKSECEHCTGGQVPRMIRDTKQVPCPKEDALVELLDAHEEIGRIVVFCGFSGSLSRCVDIAHREGWAVVQVSGKGWFATDSKGKEIPGDHLDIFQDMLVEHPRVAWIANADASGTGLTLTASPTIVYYSNSFNGESRFQSEDRCHRPSMDLNRGLTIIDLIHLPSDQGVLDNIKLKKNLQSMSMDALWKADADYGT